MTLGLVVHAAGELYTGDIRAGGELYNGDIRAGGTRCR